MKAFLVTYHSFTTPAQLFRKLVERFFVPPSINEALANKIRLRVIIVLKYWIESQFSDINHSVCFSFFFKTKKREKKTYRLHKK